jgi:hypothetical protein
MLNIMVIMIVAATDGGFTEWTMGQYYSGVPEQIAHLTAPEVGTVIMLFK